MKSFDKWARDLADHLADKVPNDEPKPPIPPTRKVVPTFAPPLYDPGALKRALEAAKAKSNKSP